jgi:UDP-N-acetylmuramoylalanine--D-glutamate ligase
VSARVHVVGLGRSGAAAALLARRKGFDVSATDLKGRDRLEAASELEAAGILLDLGRHDEALFREADIVVVSPGVPDREEFALAARRGAEVISEIEFAGRFLSAETIGVTGTNGKSTVTTMIGSIVAASGRPAWTGGNLGTALSLAVDSPADRPDGLIALELSSFQLERITSFRPRVALILNITPDHFDRYASFEEYAAAKCRIFMNQGRGDCLLVPGGDEGLRRRCAPARAALHLVGRGSGEIFFEGGRIRLRGLAGLDEDLDPGECNLSDSLAVHNGMFAVAAGLLAGVSLEAVQAGLQAFRPLRHRFQLVAEIDGVQWINDSKATNPESMIKAIEAAGKGVILLAGGLGKGLDFTPLGGAVEGRVKAALLFGRSAGEIRGVIEGKVPVETVPSLEEAARRARDLCAPGDKVLLAPGCASFDMFRNFEDRGERFIALVERMEKDAGR